jgi:hypothetical protein
VLRIAAAAGLATAGLAIGPVGAAHASPTRVAIAIAGDKTACVAWHSGITGDDVLHAVATVSYRYDGLINQIDGVPADKRADDTHFWAYWHSSRTGWVFSGEGAGTYLVHAGTVEGWAYGNKAKPPSATYGSICHDNTPAPTPTTKQASSHPPSSSSAAGPASHASTRSNAPPPLSSHAGVSASPSAAPSRHRSATASATTTSAGRPSTVDSAATSPAPTTSPAAAKRHHSSSAIPAAGTAAGIVAAAVIGGVAFWRMRRQDGN